MDGSSRRTSPPLSCCLTAHASLRLPVEAVGPLRRQPGPGKSFPISLLKNADEQTVVVVAALLQAIDRARLPFDTFTDWAALASARFIGRDCIGQAVPAYVREGPWSVSPHVIPHRSLHSTPGTLTLALGAHGPNYGVGSGPEGDVEGLLAAFALLHERPVPGVWLALSRIDPLLPCDPSTGVPAPGSFVEAVVLALSHTGSGPGLELTVGSGGEDQPYRLERLRDLLDSPAGGTCTLGRVGRLTLRPTMHKGEAA